MKQYFRLLALVLIFCTGCGAQQASTTNLTDTASPSAIVPSPRKQLPPQVQQPFHKIL